MWRSLVNLFLFTIGLFSLVTFHASLRSSPLYLLLRTTLWKAIKKSSEIIRNLAVGFFVCFCFLLSFTFCCQNLCSFGLFSPVFSAWMSFSCASLQLCSPASPPCSVPAHCWQQSDTQGLPGWNPGLIELGGRIPTDFSMARVSPFSFEVLSASESQHFCKLCFPPGTLIASAARAERMVSWGHWPGKGVSWLSGAALALLLREFYDKFIQEPKLFWLWGWARFVSHFIFLVFS